MTNFLLNIVFFMTAFMASPIASYAVGNSGIAEKEEAREAEIIVDHHSLRVTGASGKVLYIYDVTGICVMTLRIDNSEGLLYCKGRQSGQKDLCELIFFR